jgi:hypothetical protein
MKRTPGIGPADSNRGCCCCCWPGCLRHCATQRAWRPFVPDCGAAGPLVRQPESSTIRSMRFHQGNMMSNKPHLRPHQKKRQASQITRLLVVILIVAIIALGIALEATGRVVFRGRLILLPGGRWLLMWWSLACERAALASFFGQFKALAFPTIEALGVGPVNVGAGDAVEGGRGVARTCAGAGPSVSTIVTRA